MGFLDPRLERRDLTCDGRVKPLVEVCSVLVERERVLQNQVLEVRLKLAQEHSDNASRYQYWKRLAGNLKRENARLTRLLEEAGNPQPGEA